MRAFIVTLADRPGSAAEVFEAVAAAGVDLQGIAGIANGQTGIVALIPDDEDACRRALAATDHSVVETEIEMTEADNAPGSAARLARRLADAGVNIQVMLPIGMNGGRIQVAIGATDNAKLKSALG